MILPVLPKAVTARSTPALALLAGLGCVLLSVCIGESEGELARFTFTSDFTSELVTAVEAPAKLAVAPDGRLRSGKRSEASPLA